MDNPPNYLQKTLARHAHMVLDRLRTHPLRHAIAKTVRDGDVVVDIGCGIGLLSFFAAQAGAQRIYAIDVDMESLEVARFLAQRYGYADRITFLEGLSQDVDLPERADVLLGEIVGSAAFDENILPTLADAKCRHLKPDGHMIPERIELWGALAEALRPNIPAGDWAIAHVARKHLLSTPRLLSSVDTHGDIPSGIHANVEYSANRPGVCSGIAVWPRVLWARGCETNASPKTLLTHWKQAYLADAPRTMRRAQKVGVELIIQPDPKNPLFSTELLWRLR